MSIHLSAVCDCKLRTCTCACPWVLHVPVCACEQSGLCGEYPAPHSHAPSPGRGQQRWRLLRQGDPPPPPPAPPPPQPLPAGRFPDRPNRQKLRARGPLGAFLLWCELPMAGAGAGAGTQAQPNQPGHRARSPGRQAETRGRPPPAPPAPARPRPRALQPMAGPGAGRRRGGAWLASHRLRPQDLGDQLSRPALKAPRKGRAFPGEASR